MYTPSQATERRDNWNYPGKKLREEERRDKGGKGRGREGEGGKMQNLAVLFIAGRFSCDSPSLLRH